LPRQDHETRKSAKGNYRYAKERTMKEEVSPEKLRKIEALREHGQTVGEREAAAAAIERLKGPPTLQISRTIINVDQQETFYEVQYRDIEGQQQKLNLPRELRPTKIVEHNVDCGQLIARQSSPDFKQLLVA
jgi:hypothetical protein